MDPVMLLYRESNDINTVVERIVAHDEPYESINGESDTPESHHIWTVKDPVVSNWFTAVLFLSFDAHIGSIICVLRIFWRFSVRLKALSICTSPMVTTVPPPLASKTFEYVYLGCLASSIYTKPLLCRYSQRECSIVEWKRSKCRPVLSLPHRLDLSGQSPERARLQPLRQRLAVGTHGGSLPWPGVECLCGGASRLRASSIAILLRLLFHACRV